MKTWLMIVTTAALLATACAQPESGSNGGIDAGLQNVDASVRDGSAPLDAAEVIDAQVLIDAEVVIDAAVIDAEVVIDASEGVDASPIAARCACDLGGVCLETTSAASCESLMVTCDGRFLDACSRENVLYTCAEPTGSGTYYTDFAFSDFDREVRSCTDEGGTWSTTPPPAPIGAPCGCQRNARLCVGSSGTACSTLVCTEPAVRFDGECPTEDASPGRCVSFDGQTHQVFYGLSANDAARACRLARGDFYWVPTP